MSPSKKARSCLFDYSKRIKPDSDDLRADDGEDSVTLLSIFWTCGETIDAKTSNNKFRLTASTSISIHQRNSVARKISSAVVQQHAEGLVRAFRIFLFLEEEKMIEGKG